MLSSASTGAARTGRGPVDRRLIKALPGLRCGVAAAVLCAASGIGGVALLNLLPALMLVCVLLAGRFAPIAGRVMLAATADLSYEAVGGLTMGADPVAAAMMHAAARDGRILDAFVVRKGEKAHGLQRRIEGPDVKGRRVLAVEDTSTTGSSVLMAVEALQEAGAEIAGVAVLVDRGARERVADLGLPYRAAYIQADLGV